MKKVIVFVLIFFSICSYSYAMEVLAVKGFTIGIENTDKIENICILSENNISVQFEDYWYDYHYEELPSESSENNFCIPPNINPNSKMFLDMWLTNLCTKNYNSIVYKEKLPYKNGIIIIKKSNNIFNLEAMYVRQQKFYFVRYCSGESLDTLKEKMHKIIETIY